MKLDADTDCIVIVGPGAVPEGLPAGVRILRVWSGEPGPMNYEGDQEGLPGWFNSKLESLCAWKVTIVGKKEDDYGKVNRELEAAINRRSVDVMTLAKYSVRMESNSIRNIPSQIKAVPVSHLEGKFGGVPGVVVGAGPSLTGELDALRDVSGRCVIICVGKALGLLERSGVSVDFSVALDMIESSGKVFEGTKREAALLFDGDCHWEVPRNYPGRLVAYSSITDTSKWVDGLIGPMGSLRKGTSVAHTGFFLARKLGLDPIALVGVDLALPGEDTHAEGVAMTWGGKVAEKSYKTVEVPSVTGGMVKTLRGMKSFISLFEAAVNESECRVIHTSPAGALIRGTDRMSLAEASREWGPATRPEEVMASYTARAGACSRFIEEADEVLGVLRDVVSASERGLKYLRRLMRLDPDNKLDVERISSEHRRIDRVKIEIEGMEESKLLIRMMSKDMFGLRKVRALGNEGDTKRRESVARELEVLFNAYSAAAKAYRENLEWTVECLKS